MPKKCHICGNVAFNSENYVRCSNVRQSLANGRPICTRVICRDCHDDYGWDFHAAMADPHWTCTHCRDVCPKCAPAEDPYVLEAGHDTELGRVYGQQPGMRGQLANAQRQHAFWALLKEINRAKVEGELADAAAAAPAPPPRAPPPDQSWADWAMDQVGSMPITVRGATSGEDFTVAEGLGAVASVVTGGLTGDGGGGRNLSDRLSDLMVQQQVGRTPRQHGGTSALAPPAPAQQPPPRRHQAPTPAVAGAPPPLPAGPPAYDPAWAEPPSLLEPAALEGADELAESSSDERIACWGSPDAFGDAWAHAGAAAVMLSLRTGEGGAIVAHRIVALVGGRGDGVPPGGTLVHAFDPRQRRWLPVEQRGAAPSRLYGHVACALGARVAVCGGGDGRHMSSALYVLTFEVRNAARGGAPAALVASWSHPQVRGGAPPPRAGHCGVQLGSESVLLFGGFCAPPKGKGKKSKGGAPPPPSDDGGGYSNALFGLNLRRGVWSQPLVQLGAGSLPPAARVGATATALDAHAAVLFGGAVAAQPSAALDLLRASDEPTAQHAQLLVSQPAVDGAPPPPRYHHCAAHLGGGAVVIYGGKGGADGQAALGDVALLDMAAMRWSLVELRGVPPAPRAAHAAAAVAVGTGAGAARQLWVFGGSTAGGMMLNDIHVLELGRTALAAAPAARRLAPPGAVAPPRRALDAAAAGADAPTQPPRLRPPPAAKLPQRLGPPWSAGAVPLAPLPTTLRAHARPAGGGDAAPPQIVVHASLVSTPRVVPRPAAAPAAASPAATASQPQAPPPEEAVPAAGFWGGWSAWLQGAAGDDDDDEGEEEEGDEAEAWPDMASAAADHLFAPAASAAVDGEAEHGDGGYDTYEPFVFGGAAPAAAAAAALPAGWKETATPDGRTYCYHAATRRTSWEVPSA